MLYISMQCDFFVKFGINQSISPISRCAVVSKFWRDTGMAILKQIWLFWNYWLGLLNSGYRLQYGLSFTSAYTLATKRHKIVQSNKPVY